MANESDLWSPNWLRHLPGLEVVSIPDTAKDEFIHHLFAYMREAHGYGHSGQTRIEPDIGRVDEWKLNASDGRELPRLWIINGQDGLMLALVGKGEQTEADLLQWRQGIETATSRIGTRDKLRWVAVLAQKQPDAYTFSGQRLSESKSFQGLSFALFGDGVCEDVQKPFAGIGVGTGEFFHWPLEVQGATSCYTWDRDGYLLTLHRLRRVSALLSLAWDAPWAVREGPRDPSAFVTQTNGQLMGHSWRKISDEAFRDSGTPISIPGWLDNAEAAIRKKPRLGNALFMHQEGLTLKRDHPSMALVCFVSAVETVAQVKKDPEKCPECKMVLSSGKRFKNAVTDVLDQEQAADLTSAYSKRSTTVHQGRLHGVELQANDPGRMSLFTPDKEFMFTVGTVRAAQEASRRLLFRALDVQQG